MNWSVMVFLISCIVRAMVLVRSEELGVRSEGEALVRSMTPNS